MTLDGARTLPMWWGPCIDFQYQPIVSEILTQPSRYKGEESNLPADEKAPLYLVQVVV